ncbi:MAG: acetyl-CoA carboxylase, biotin carboxyl carrier protein, partial [Ruminococcus sp.]|nr:acetyl-CoA carboxylase, biotin carboxyl carrier protein [Ruminococcus sp.]
MDNKLLDVIEIEAIEKIAEIVSKNELSEVTVKISDCVVTVKGKKPQPVSPAMPVPMGVPAQTVSVQAQTVSDVPAKQEIKGNVVKSPIVGTFYQAPSPDKPPFVKVGDT